LKNNIKNLIFFYISIYFDYFLVKFQKMTDVKQAPKKVNPVYQALRTRVFQTANELRKEWDTEGETKVNLSARNKGVRCFMKKSDIFGDNGKDLAAAIAEQRTDTRTQILVSRDSAVDTLALSDTLIPATSALALYSPSPAPCDVIYGGLPSEITDLAIRSTLLWQIKAPSLHLSESDQLCKLYAMTSFFLPNVQVRKENYESAYKAYAESDRFDTNVIVMSDLESVVNYLTEQGSEDIKTSNLIYLKLMIPFMLAVRQNQNRKNLGLPPIRDLVIGDVNIKSSERGMNTLFCQRLQSIVQQFDGVFNSVTVCGSNSLLMHLSTLTELADQ